MVQPASAGSLQPGSILVGKYEVVKILGQGGMGIVLEARHTVLDERVAIKLLLPEYASNVQAQDRFLREAKAAIKIKSQHVARVSDVGSLDTGEPFIVMEMLEGSDLDAVLDEKGPLPLAEAVDYILQGSEAVAEAHSYGIVHRDLKPANLFVARHADGRPLVKVLDFGISKVMSAEGATLTQAKAMMGSAFYMPPEQMRDARGADHRADIYALGATLFKVLTGRHLFEAETLPELCMQSLTGTPPAIRSLRGDLPEAFGPVLEKAYARLRNERYATMADFAAALLPFGTSRSAPIVERIQGMSGPRALDDISGPPKVAPIDMPRDPKSGGETASLASAQTVTSPEGAALAMSAANREGATTGSWGSTHSPGSVTVPPEKARGSRAPLFIAIAGVVLVGGAATWLQMGGQGAAMSAAEAPVEALTVIAAAQPLPAEEPIIEPAPPPSAEAAVPDAAASASAAEPVAAPTQQPKPAAASAPPKPIGTAAKPAPAKPPASKPAPSKPSVDPFGDERR